jgi:hypothetical protein
MLDDILTPCFNGIWSRVSRKKEGVFLIAGIRKKYHGC